MLIEVHGEAKPAGSKMAYIVKGRARITDDCKKSRSWKTDVNQVAADAWGDQPLLIGPVYLQVVFFIQRPKSHYGTGKNAATLKASSPEYHTSKPDATKLLRAVEDALTGVCWRDDAQVCVQKVMKRYSDKHLTVIDVRPMSDGLEATP